MKLKMRHTMRKSREEIENSFNPINLDHIFNEEDPLSEWLEERENPLLDGTQNVEWLPRDDSDEEEMGEEGGNNSSPNQTSSGSGNRGLSPPSDRNDDDDDNDDGDDENRQDYRSLSSINEELNLDDIGRYRRSTTIGSSSGAYRDPPQFGRKRVDMSDGSSSAGMAGSHYNLDLGDSSQSNQSYPPIQSFHPSFMNYPPHDYFPNAFGHQSYHYPSHYPQPHMYPSSSINYQEQPNENAPPGFNYLFGQALGYHSGESDEGEDSNFEHP